MSTIDSNDIGRAEYSIAAVPQAQSQPQQQQNPPFSPVPRSPVLPLPRLITPRTSPLTKAADAAATATANAGPRPTTIVMAQCSQGRACEDASWCSHVPCDYGRSTLESGRHDHTAERLSLLYSLLECEQAGRHLVREPPKTLKMGFAKMLKLYVLGIDQDRAVRRGADLPQLCHSDNTTQRWGVLE